MRKCRGNNHETECIYLFFSHGTDDGDQEILAIIKASLDILSEITLGNTDVILSNTLLSHEVKEAIIKIDLFMSARSGGQLVNHVEGTHELVFRASDVRDIHVVSGRANIFLEKECCVNTHIATMITLVKLANFLPVKI